MVSVVLGNPPAEAQPDERVGHDEPEHLIAPARAENLVVPCIMADEAQLGEHHPHQWGDGEGHPRVADHDEQRPSGEEREDRQGDLHPVVAGPAVEQTHRSYLPRQCAKAGRRRIDGSRLPVCSGGAAGVRGQKAGCCCLHRSVPPGRLPSMPLGLTSPGSGATRLRSGPARHDSIFSKVPPSDGPARPTQASLLSRVMHAGRGDEGAIKVVRCPLAARS
jgi:hypothetical protein